MQNYADFRKTIRRLIASNSFSSDTLSTLNELENQVFDIYLTFTSKIDESNADLIKALKERISIGDQLNTTKESMNKIIKCYNMSMKAASCTIARAIIEMTAREHAREIDSSVENLMNQFRIEKKYSNNRYIIDLIQDAKTRSFWNRLSSIDQNNVDLYLKWHNQNLQNKNFVPTNDVLRLLWSKSKPTDMITSLIHPKFGPFSAKIEDIKVSFMNLYHTLSEMIHNSTVPYEDGKLPIPDIVDGQFTRSDALALASFYKLTLPNIEFEFVTNIVRFSADSTDLFNRMDGEYSHIVLSNL